MDPARRRALADDNEVAAYDLIRRHAPGNVGGRREFGRAVAIASGHPVGYFNPVFVIDSGAAPEDVVAAVDWIESLGLPVTVRVHDGADPGVAPMLEARGLQLDPEPETVMILASIPDPPAPPDDARIRTGGTELIKDWHAAFEANDRLRAILNADLVADPDVRIAVLDVDGDPVAGAMAFRTDEVLGVYTVATVDRARRRGFGRAVTWAAIEAGRAAWGSRIAVLQSSAMGRSVYASMGFEETGAIGLFRAPRPSG